MFVSPLILEIVAMKNISQVLERLGDSLGKLQKALGDYLERQRSGFSRFYFVGDEDLLEMIGNGRDPVQVRAQAVGCRDAGRTYCAGPFVSARTGFAPPPPPTHTYTPHLFCGPPRVRSP